MTSDSWPSPLKLEVKISRTTQHSLSERDLSGIKPDGFVAVLITDRFQHGPRWVLLPGGQLHPGNHSDATLSPLAESSLAGLALKLNVIWSNWLLDEPMWAKLFEQQHMNLMPALEWCLQHHQPRLNRSTGNVRESKLQASLQHFRSRLDAFLATEKGPQQEGFIHQRLLAHALTTIGYTLAENPIGVPDISAIRSSDTQPCVHTIRERLREWQPSNTELTALRETLLGASEDDLRAVCKVIGI